MAVTTHLRIPLRQYDARIRTFIPDYVAMLDAAAGALVVAARPVRLILDLGIGSGALARRCARACPGAAVIGIDEDAGMIALAQRRLRQVRAGFVNGNFVTAPLPKADAVTASFALHHVRTARAKAGLYRRIYRALGPGGVFVTADCCTASSAVLRARDRNAWRVHLERAYSRRRAEMFLRAWAREDVYVPLEDELAMMRAAGFRPDVVWRKGAFAVIGALKK
jgi:tRNA (cmo5U34)-methyltransferase